MNHASKTIPRGCSCDRSHRCSVELLGNHTHYISGQVNSACQRTKRTWLIGRHINATKNRFLVTRWGFTDGRRLSALWLISEFLFRQCTLFLRWSWNGLVTLTKRVLDTWMHGVKRVQLPSTMHFVFEMMIEWFSWAARIFCFSQNRQPHTRDQRPKKSSRAQS